VRNFQAAEKTRRYSSLNWGAPVFGASLPPPFATNPLRAVWTRTFTTFRAIRHEDGMLTWPVPGVYQIVIITNVIDTENKPTPPPAIISIAYNDQVYGVSARSSVTDDRWRVEASDPWTVPALPTAECRSHWCCARELIRKLTVMPATCCSLQSIVDCSNWIWLTWEW